MVFDASVRQAVADSSVNGNTGPICNSTWTTSGEFGDALVFNGTTALVTVNDSAYLRSSAFIEGISRHHARTVSSQSGRQHRNQQYGTGRAI